jgi:hypothetical protein
MQQLISYNFAIAENPLSNGGKFTAITNDFSGALQAIGGNLCEAATVGAQPASFWSGYVPGAPGGAWPNDQYSEITLASFTVGGSENNSAFIIVRQGSPLSGKHYYLQLQAAGTPTYYTLLAKDGATVHTLVAFTPTTIAPSDVWRLSVAGNVLTWSRNGAQVGTFTDTNRYVTSGSPGFGFSVSGDITHAQTGLWAGGGTVSDTLVRVVGYFGDASGNPVQGAIPQQFIMSLTLVNIGPESEARLDPASVNTVLANNGYFKGLATQFLITGYALLNAAETNPAGGVLS